MPLSMTSRSFFDPDAVAMPPPPTRVRASDWERAGAPVSPEQQAGNVLTSIMKRRRCATCSPTEEVEQRASKKVKTHDGNTSPTIAKKTKGKLDPNVFASAFALASLALSPQRQANAVPYSHMPIQARDNDPDRTDGDNGYLREPSSPNMSTEDIATVSPEYLSSGMLKRRAQFDNRIKSMDAIPGRMPDNHMGSPNRRLMRRGHPFQSVYPQQRPPFWMHHPNSHPWYPLAPPPVYHRHGPPHQAPPLPPIQKEWLCDFCHVAAFNTYQEACAHETSCWVRCDGPKECKLLLQEDYSIISRDDDHSVTSHKLQKSKSEVRDTEATELEDPKNYFPGSIALCVPSADSEWLSELNCFVRKYCVEAYAATKYDILRASKRGRISLNQVGIRCKFCANRDAKDKEVAAISYPTTVTGIYESVKRWQRVHQLSCQDVPEEIKTRLVELGNAAVWVPTTRQYWSDSARALGMTDTHDGIRFERPPSVPDGWMPDNQPESSGSGEVDEDAGLEAGFIALPYEKDLIPHYVYFLLRQVEVCKFTEADRFVARSKGPIGFAGFQCRHCSGHAGLGRYFPLTTKSLSTNSTSQNIHAHLLKCRKCPSAVKEKLLHLKSEKGKSPRRVPGWRREFFDRVWERLHGDGVKN